MNSMLRCITMGFALIWGLTACSPGDSASVKQSFNANDISGANYGKGFMLKDVHGQPRSLADYRGKVVSLFFGYTQCPDVCPTNLLGMAQVMKLLGPDADRVQVLFATIDPERDTPELLAQYVPAFDPRFVGLYGTAEETRQVAQEFKVLYQKQGSGPHYTVDHTTGTYVFDPEGRLRLYVAHNTKPELIAEDIRRLLKPAQ